MQRPLSKSAIVFLIVILVIIAKFVLPWHMINWGKISLQPAETITVTGTASSDEKTQIATFTAGATAVGSDAKQVREEVDTKLKTVVENLKNFGIPDADIQTQSTSLYQEQESYTQDGAQRMRPGQWRADNTIEIKLRDVAQADALLAILNDGQLTNIYGPQFMFDDVSETQDALLADAVKDARTRADILAQAAGKKVVKVLSITESGASTPVYPMFDRAMSGGGGGGIMPGTGEVSAGVTVVFEVR